MAATPKPKVSVLLSPAEYARFTAFCKQKGYKKSTLAARLIREHLDRERFQMQVGLPLGNEGDQG